MIYNGDLFDTTDLQGLSLGEYWFKIQVFAAAQDLTLLGLNQRVILVLPLLFQVCDLKSKHDLQRLCLGEYWFKIQVFAAAQDLVLVGFKPTSEDLARAFL